MNKINSEFEKAKYLVTRNVTLFAAIGLLILVVFNIITKDNNLVATIIGLAIALLTVIILLKTKRYFAPTIIALVCCYALNTYNLFFSSTFSNFIDVFWMLNLSLYAFYTLGKTTGLSYLYLNIISLTTITILGKFDYLQIQPPNEITIAHSINFAINVFVCTTVFGYLLSQIFVQTERSKNEMTKINVELNQQYDEKSIMLKEIHHRVKNNLQVITSLLRLQLYKIDNVENAAPFNESIDRISSMALIHEKMYQGDKVENIDLEEYINDLARRLNINYSNDTSVDLHIESTVKTIGLNYIVPFSLILNELMTNSFKHAFKDLSEGKITIKLSKSEGNHLQFNYADNGTWQKPLDSNSFGLELIDTFSEQIGGTYTLNTDLYTDYNFTFMDIIIEE